MDRSGDPALAADELLAAERIDRHDGRIAQKAAEFHLIAHAFSDHGDQSDGRCLLVDHADGHLIGDDSGDGRSLCVAGDRVCRPLDVSKEYSGRMNLSLMKD